MISVMYKHYNNQVDQIFKMLPRALQWEILVDFVGGFVVRYNRLRRIMSGVLQRQMLVHNFGINELSLYKLWGKPRVESPVSYRIKMIALNRNLGVLHFKCDGQPWINEEDPELLLTVASAEFSRRVTFVVLFKHKHTGQLSYGFHSRSSRHWYITEMDDSVVLPPFEQHVYPSYPYTNKKLGRPVLKMKLHDPIPRTPSGLEYKDIKAWKDGKRFY